MAKPKDALRTLRLAARRVKACDQAVHEALQRPEEIRRLELDVLAQAVERLKDTVEQAQQAFPGPPRAQAS